jgi:hypothetical protein
MKKFFSLLLVGIMTSMLFAQTVFAAATDGTMTNMDSGDIVDSGFDDDGNIMALDLDGVDDVVVVPNSDSLEIGDNLSFSGWVDCGAQGTDDYMISKGSAWILTTLVTYPNSSRRLRLITSDDGSFGAGHMNEYWQDNEDLLPASGWAHVGFTFDGGVVKMYINGSEASSTVKLSPATTIYTSGGGNLIFGHPSAYGWQGKITNYSIWDTGVLSTDDWTSLYNSGDGLDPSELTPTGSANLVSSWLWNTSLTHPTVPDNAASGGASVPEFSTYAYLAMILLAFGAMYYAAPNLGLRTR